MEIHSLHLGLKPRASRVSRRYAKFTVSKALWISNLRKSEDIFLLYATGAPYSGCRGSCLGCIAF
jgi:hypothetical protein